MSSYDKLVEGYRKFRAEYLSEENADWLSKAKDKQSPKVMVIACSDSRVNPVILTQAGLGDIFVVHNVANLVPPYKQSGNTHHSTSAAIEFAVKHLKVEHIIIKGHSGCGGINALMADHDHKTVLETDAPYSFIRPWMDIVEKASEFSAEEKSQMDEDALATLCERRATLISLENLKGFPWVREAIEAKALKLHAWHFDIASGRLVQYNSKTDAFEELV
ncbi:carbonic anhydrase [Paremcibacter congregatus]|uniref:Carbonic anhydrase n=1 Tax=Paremcibacter congregatus TaxID=2043170 RepID=A0A2G4YSP9_9PROT|nr:carbonic anhydrase [Paremcibacter congregatus]PHZ84466.1 carbonic anhydrase [Paremcibacter congregatus]QDE28684.1 carbonic anhydrase [Paremcibacter congregatus]